MQPSWIHRGWFVLGLAAACGVAGADWPQLRGPNGAAVSRETGLPLEWSATRNIVWKTPLPGPGSSSPVVLGTHVYLTCYSGYGGPGATGTVADLKRHLVCVDRDSGQVLWTATLPAAADAEPPFANVALHGYASSTPVADASGVYVYWGSTGAAGFSHAGTRKWLAPCGPRGPLRDTNSAASPILHGDLLLLIADHPAHQGDTIALDKQTGREVWRHRTGGCYISPMLLPVRGRTELVVGSIAGRWLGLDPATGKDLWQCAAPMYAATPVAHDGVVHVTGGDRRAAIRGGGQGDVTWTRGYKLWDAPAGVIVSSPVLHDGHLYWCADKGSLVYCAEARQQGKVIYRERLPGGGAGDRQVFASPVVAEGRIYYVTCEQGTYVVAASPTFALLAHNRIEDDPSAFHATPAISGGRLFLRSQRYLYCIGSR